MAPARDRASRPRRRRHGGTPEPEAGRPQTPCRGLPVHLLHAQPCPAAPLAPRSRSRSRWRRRQGWMDVLPVCRRRGAGELRGLPRGSLGHSSIHPRPVVSDCLADCPPRLLRAARVGDGVPRDAPEGASCRLATAARPGGDRCGGRVTPDPLLALRRVPVLHPRRAFTERPSANMGFADCDGATRLSPRKHGPTEGFSM